MRATTAAVTTGRRRRERQSCRPLTSRPAPRSPPPSPRLLPSLSSGYGCTVRQAVPPTAAATISNADDRPTSCPLPTHRRHDNPPSATPTIPHSSTAHLPPRSPVAAVVATAAAVSESAGTVGHVVPATDPSGRSLFVCRRCHGCCHLFAAVMVRQAVPATAATTTTHRRQRRQDHIRRPLTSLPAFRPPPPLPRLLPSLCSRYG